MALNERLEISVYRADTLGRVGLISSWISLSWVENYAKHGMMQLEIPADARTAKLLQNGRCCGLTGREALMIIRNVKLLDKRLIVTGYTAEKALEERVAVETIPEGTNIEEKGRAMLAAMNPYPRMTPGREAGLEDVTEKEKEARSVGGAIAEMIADADIGFRARHDKQSRMLFLEFYKPEATGMKYGTMYGNVGDVTMTIDDIDARNVAVVYGEKPEENAEEGAQEQIVVTVGDTEATGENRRELYVNAGDLTREDGETDEAYRARLAVRGMEELAAHALRQTFSLNVKDERADVGSVITANLPELGVRLSMRITSVKIVAQRGKVSRELIYGDPFGIIRRN